MALVKLNAGLALDAKLPLPPLVGLIVGQIIERGAVDRQIVAATLSVIDHMLDLRKRGGRAEIDDVLDEPLSRWSA